MISCFGMYYFLIMKEFFEKLTKISPLTIIIILIIIIIVLIFMRFSQNAFDEAASNPAAKMFDYSKNAVVKIEETPAAEIKISNNANVQNIEGIVLVTGFRDANDISDEIRFHIVSMKYKFHLKKIAPPSQQVVVKVSIDKYGRVSNPQIVSPDTLSQNSRDLILSDLLTWQFVQIKQDGETTASFPLNLKNRLQSQ